MRLTEESVSLILKSLRLVEVLMKSVEISLRLAEVLQILCKEFVKMLPQILSKLLKTMHFYKN